MKMREMKRKNKITDKLSKDKMKNNSKQNISKQGKDSLNSSNSNMGILYNKNISRNLNNTSSLNNNMLSSNNILSSSSNSRTDSNKCPSRDNKNSSNRSIKMITMTMNTMGKKNITMTMVEIKEEFYSSKDEAIITIIRMVLTIDNNLKRSLESEASLMILVLIRRQ